MSSQYKSSLKEHALKMLEGMDLEEIAEKIVNNQLGFKQFKKQVIKEEYERLEGSKPKQDIYVDLEEKHGLKERALRSAVSGR